MKAKYGPNNGPPKGSTIRSMFMVAVWGLVALASMQFLSQRWRGRCEIVSGTIVRCDTTGEISMVDDGQRRQFSAEVYAAYGFPLPHLNETGTCEHMLTCPLGAELPMPDTSGGCQIQDGSLVRCHSTGEISLIEGGQRHAYSGEVYAAYGAPHVHLNLTGSCASMYACPAGTPMEKPTVKDTCEIPDGTLVRCNTTGEISLIENNARRMYSMDAYRAYGSPLIHMYETGACLRMYSCQAGVPMPKPTGSNCEIPDGTIVRCNSTGEISLMENGQRRPYSGVAYIAYGSPPIGLNLTESCEKLVVCPVGEPMPQPVTTGGCGIPDGTLVRCNTTGEISLIDGSKRRVFSAAAYAAYGEPPVHLNLTSTCQRLLSCGVGELMPLPQATGCDIPDSTVVRCNTTGEIALIQGGVRRVFGGAAWAAYHSVTNKDISLTENSICPKMYSCLQGEKMPQPHIGECDIPDGTLVRCNTTGDIALMDKGTRRIYSPEVYKAFGSPKIHLTEYESCIRIYSCLQGEKMPMPATGGGCDLPEGTIVRCPVTGEISLIDGGMRRGYTVESYLAYGEPKAHMDSNDVCLRMLACPSGDVMPLPVTTGGCLLAEGSVVHCHTTGETSLISNGARRKFTPELYIAFNSPEISLNETGICPRVFSCPAGTAMVAQARRRLRLL